VKLAIVTPEDIARYTVRALDDVRAENRHVAITPTENLLMQNELIAMWESKTKLRLKRHTISARELDRAIMDLANRPDKVKELSFTQLVRAVWIEGLGGKRRPDVLELTELYPDIPYQRVTSYLDRFISSAQSAH
jgi:leucoanthocyanidin reductase